MRKILLLLCLLLVVSMAEGKVTLQKAAIDPTAAAPGDEVSVVVVFDGDVDGITEVVMIPREYAYDIDQPFPLMQDESAENTWILKGQVPWDAPAGPVNLEIKAVDKNGKDVVVEEYKDQIHGKAGLIEFEVK